MRRLRHRALPAIVRPCRCPARQYSLVDLAESDGVARQRRSGEHVLRLACFDRRPFVAARAGVNPRDARVGVDDPKLSDAVARIKSRLEPLIIGEARDRNLDNQVPAILILTICHGGCEGGWANAKVVSRFCQEGNTRKTVIDRSRSKKRARAAVLLMGLSQRA